MSQIIASSEFPMIQQQNFYTKVAFSNPAKEDSLRVSASDKAMEMLNYFNRGVTRIILIIAHGNMEIELSDSSHQVFPDTTKVKAIDFYHTTLREMFNLLCQTESVKVSNVTDIPNTYRSFVTITLIST